MAGQLERQPEVEHIKVEVKFVWQISYPSADGVSQGNYFLPISHKLTQPWWLGVIGSKFLTARQTDKFFDPIYGCMWIFSFS